MGTAVWLYLWLLGKQTGEEGDVLYGRPLDMAVIQADLGLTDGAVRGLLRRLEVSDYVAVTRSSGGPCVRICNPKRRFKPVKSYRDPGKILPRGGKNLPRDSSARYDFTAPTPYIGVIYNKQESPPTPPCENFDWVRPAFDELLALWPNPTGVNLAETYWADFCSTGQITAEAFPEIKSKLVEYLESKQVRKGYKTSFAKWISGRGWRDSPEPAGPNGTIKQRLMEDA